MALLYAPALALPEVSKDVSLFVDEKLGTSKGVLTQRLGPWNRPVAYLSKKLDSVAAGWPPCLRIIAAVAWLVKEADKLTFGQAISVTTPTYLGKCVTTAPGTMDSKCKVDSLSRTTAR